MADLQAEISVATHTSQTPVGFGHHVLYAGEKYDEMVNWYATFFQGEVMTADAPSAELLARDDIDTIMIVRRPDLDQEGREFRTGIFHVAWSYASLAELMTVYEHAKSWGILPLFTLNTGILLQIYYADPEGNRIELEVDAHDTSEETQQVQRSGLREVLMSEWRYDPDMIVKLMRAGWSDYDILNHKKYHEAVQSGQY